MDAKPIQTRGQSHEFAPKPGPPAKLET